MGLYQVKRKFSCIVRAEFAEFCRLRIPVLSDWLRPGLFNTLKKSALKRSRTCSLIGDGLEDGSIETECACAGDALILPPGSGWC